VAAPPAAAAPRRVAPRPAAPAAWCPLPRDLPPLSLPVRALALVLLLAAGAWSLRFADPLPLSDEAGHLSKVFWLVDRVRRPESAVAAVHQLLISGDAYPQLPHLLGAASLRVWGGIEGVRASNLLMHAVHLIVALRVGPALFGRAGALAYALLVSLSPILLAWQRVFFIDLALTEAVGVALLLLWSSPGLRLRRPLAGFALAAAAGMLCKWVFGLFLLVPAALAVVGALWGLRRGALGVGLGLGVASGGAVAAMLGLGSSPWLGIISAEAPLAPLAIGAMGLGLLLGLAGALGPGQPRAGARGLLGRALLVIGVVVLIAGPFYTLAQPLLWERLALEEAVHDQAGHRAPLAWSVEVLLSLVPMGQQLVLGALILMALRDRARLLRALGALGGVGLSFGVLTAGLPFDPRYQLPLLPLLAAAVASAFPALGRLGGPAVLALGLLLGARSLLQLWPEPRVSRDGLLGAAVELEVVGGMRLPRLAARTRHAGVAAEVDKLTAAAAGLCAAPCTLHFEGPIEGAIQGRGLEALLLLDGAHVQVRENAPALPGQPRVRSACHPAGPPAAPPGCVHLAAPRADCAVWSCGVEPPGAAPDGEGAAPDGEGAEPAVGAAPPAQGG